MRSFETFPHSAQRREARLSGATTGGVQILLRLEGAAVLIASLVTYHLMGGSWAMFLLLFLAPDLSMAGYALGTKAGAAAYNSAHTYLGPAVLAGLAWRLNSASVSYLISAIWIAHIGLDRLLGFGLKYPSCFTFTHLGTLKMALGGRSKTPMG